MLEFLWDTLFLWYSPSIFFPMTLFLAFILDFDIKYLCRVHLTFSRSERTLKRHALFTHGKGRRRFECDTCDKTFASNYTLRRHVVLARCAGKPCERCTNASCKDDRKSVILRRVFAYVLSRAISAQWLRHVSRNIVHVCASFVLRHRSDMIPSYNVFYTC